MEIESKTWFVTLRKYVTTSSKRLEVVGLAGLVILVVADLVDIIGSKAFQWPLPGSTEITIILQLMLVSSGLAYSKISGQQIQVTFLVDLLSSRGKAAFEIFVAIVSLGLFVVIGWMMYVYGTNLLGSGTTTALLKIPFYPFAFWIVFCCIPMCCVIILDLISAIIRTI